MDAKGRFTFPSTLRDKMTDTAGEKLIITSDPMSGSLLIYTKPQWDLVLTLLMEKPNSEGVIQAFGQSLMGDAHEVDFDANGRLVIPPFLRKSAQLEKRLVVRGVGKKIEVWSEIVFEAAATERQALLRDPSSRAALGGLSY